MQVDQVNPAPPIQQSGSSGPHSAPPSEAYRNKTWREAEGQKETRVRLDRLPPTLTFPENFPEPITYDPARQQLMYRGLMFSGSYAYLRKMSTDPAYLAALDQLFIGTSCNPSKTGRWLLMVSALAGVALAAAAVWWRLR